MKSMFTRRYLTAAIGFALLAASVTMTPSVSLAHDSVPLATPDEVVADGPLIFFGGPDDAAHVKQFAEGLPSTRILFDEKLDDADIERLIAPAAQAMVVVSAGQLDALGDRRGTLSRMFEAGVPVFVCMDDEGRHAVTRFFGVGPSGGDTIFIREKNGNIDIIGSSEDESHWTPRRSAQLAAAVERFQDAAAGLPMSAPRTAADNKATVPMLRVHEGVFDTGSDEITGKLAIDVIRSVDRFEDDKLINVYVWPTYAPKGAGIYEGHKKGDNLSAAYLPWEYRVSHKVVADGEKPSMVAHLPATETRTEFEYRKSSERKFSVGGTTGDSISSDGKPDSLLAAKIPFSISVGYEHTTREELAFNFKDYALLAREINGGQAMLWEVPIDDKLKHVLVERAHSDGVDLTEKRMTPMMRTAGIATSSAWELPGTYEGIARVEISAGFLMNVKKWWWDGPSWRHSDTTASTDRMRSYELDLSHPYLTREMTVLLRSEQGNGLCMVQRQGVVELATCDPGNRAQMWGLDSESRYVNRSNQQCLQADMGTGTLMTAKCSLSNNQRWEWRADRIHSGYDGRMHRLYVNNGQLRVLEASGRFEDTPVNPHSPALKPWAGYPAKPLVGELIPAPFGTVPGHVPAEWSTKFNAVGVEQRWSPVVLRANME